MVIQLTSYDVTAEYLSVHARCSLILNHWIVHLTNARCNHHTPRERASVAIPWVFFTFPPIPLILMRAEYFSLCSAVECGLSTVCTCTPNDITLSKKYEVRCQYPLCGKHKINLFCANKDEL